MKVNPLQSEFNVIHVGEFNFIYRTVAHYINVNVADRQGASGYVKRSNMISTAPFHTPSHTVTPSHRHPISPPSPQTRTLAIRPQEPSSSHIPRPPTPSLVSQERSHQRAQSDEESEKHKNIIRPRHLTAAQDLIGVAPIKRLLAVLGGATVQNGIQSRRGIVLGLGAVDATQSDREGNAARQQEHGGEGVEGPGDDAVEAVDEEGGDADEGRDEAEGAREGAVVCRCGHGAVA